MKSSYGKMIGSGALSTLLAVAPLANAAAPEPVAVQSVGDQLANALCACANAGAIAATVTQFESFGLGPEGVAQAFGAAAFQSELGRCKNPQAILDGYAAYKSGKDVQALDIAFANGRVGAEVHAGTGNAGGYQGSFASLGNAGDAPSGQ